MTICYGMPSAFLDPNSPSVLVEAFLCYENQHDEIAIDHVQHIRRPKIFYPKITSKKMKTPKIFWANRRVSLASKPLAFDGSLC